ncbi:hypothetical protein Hanom_Chr09g00871041 [Helianthus anomalus]
MTVIAGGCVLSRPVTSARSWITSGKLVQKLEFLGDDCKCKTTTLRTLGMPKKLDQTTGIVRSLPIFANALLLTTPLEALAEACEQPDQSIFNMNMPLLLLVALIGATVGGNLALLFFFAPKQSSHNS